MHYLVSNLHTSAISIMWVWGCVVTMFSLYVVWTLGHLNKKFNERIEKICSFSVWVFFFSIILFILTPPA